VGTPGHAETTEISQKVLQRMNEGSLKHRDTGRLREKNSREFTGD
jgi:hypothetical protein